MISRQYFSQKEIILWSLNNHEFKDKDSWENKGQFRDKMIDFGLLKKYSYKKFKKLHPNEIDSAASAYETSFERKRVILEMSSFKLIDLLIPSFADKFDSRILDLIPIKEYAIHCLNKQKKHTIKDYIQALILGCATQKIIVFNQPKITTLCNVFSEYIMVRYDEKMKNLNDEITFSRNLFEKNIRKYIESR